MQTKPDVVTSYLRRFGQDFDRLFDAALAETEAERAEYALYQSTIEHSPGMTFDQWRRARAARGNTEGQNHD